MALVDTERAEALYAAMGPGGRDLGRLGGEHDGRARVVRRRGRVHRPGPRRPARRGLRPRPPRRRRAVRHAAGDGRLADGPLPHRGDARRRAHAEHVPRRVGRARRADVDPDLIAVGGDHVPRGLPLGPARRAGGVPLAAAAPRTTPATGSRSRCRTRSRRAAPRDVPRPRRGRRSTSCSRTKPRSAALYEVDDFDAALQQVTGHCEIAALTRGEKGSVIVRGDEVHVVDAHPIPGGKLVDTTGAGDLYAAGFLHGFTHGYDLDALRPARRARRGRGHLAPRRPARDEPGRARRARSSPESDGEAPPLPHRRPRARPARSRRSSTRVGAGRNARPHLRAHHVRAPPRAGRRVARRPEDRERGAEGDALRVPRVRAVPRGAEGVDLRLGPHAARRPALRPGPPARRRAGRARLDGHHRRRPGDHGSGHRGRGRRQLVRRDASGCRSRRRRASSSKATRSS